ncbi:MFS transporter [Rhizobium sp. 0TCS1.26]|uniref:MFS transporter n=1 Tax=Rhizobium sp. 0TCS1.26 TaxID=3142623 RepID=UPI003D2D9187
MDQQSRPTDDVADPAASGWRELISAPYGLRLTVVSAGIALHAFNEIAIAPVIPLALDALQAPWLLPFLYASFFLSVIAGGLSAAPLRRRLGARHGLMLAGGIYLAAVAMQSLAPNAGLLLAGRALQGLSDGWIVALCYSLIADLFPPRQVPRVFSVEAILWAVAALLGPLAGGLTAQFVHWRAALAVSLPFIVILYSVLPIALPRGAEPRPAPPAGTPELAPSRRRQILPPGLFGFRSTLGRGTWMLFLMTAAQSVSAVFMAYSLTHVFRLSPAAAGFVVVTLALTWSIVALPVATVTRAASKARTVSIGPFFQVVGCLLIAAGFYLQVLPLVIAGQVMNGTAFGLVYAIASQAIIEDATPEHRMATGSLLPSVSTSGGVFGSTVIGGLASAAGIVGQLAVPGPHAGVVALWGTASVLALLAAFAAQGIRPKAAE